MSVSEIFAAVLAIAVAAFVVWRWRRLSLERKGIGVLVVLALAVYASGVLSALPDPKKLIGDIAQALGVWTYALVGLMAFLETGAFVGLVAPGETVVIAGGVIAGEGTIQLLPLIGLVWIAAILGDTTSFYIGRRLGRGFLERHGPRVKITPERLAQVEAYFDRHGGKTILIGRFIGLVRALAPFIAGSSGLTYRRFVPYSIIGTGLWASIFCTLGYIFWRSFDRVASIAGQAALGFGVTVAVIVAVVVAYRRRAEIHDWVLAHERHPLLRPVLAAGRPIQRLLIGPVWHAVAPRVHVLWNRVTPGSLGLELSTTVAIASVGMYVYVLYVVVLSGSLRPTPLDTEMLDFADRLYNETAVDIVKVVTELGALPVVVTLVLVTSIVLASRRRWGELLVLVAGLVLVFVAVHVGKDVIDRPRPAGPLVDTDLSSFPSGHAAYATAWIAVAIVLTRRLGLATSGTLVFIAIAIAAAVGLSRIYLRAHYWSDVAAGWGIGCGIFALLAAIALVVDHVRQNDAQRRARPSGSPAASAER